MNAAEDAIHVIIPIFCVATMFAMGLDVTLAEAVAPLRQKLALGITVLVNNVLIPLLGFLIVALPALLAAEWLESLGLKDLALTGSAQMGFLLLLLASGSLLGPTLARIAGANEVTAKGVMVALSVASAVLVPIELKLLCSSNAVTACNPISTVDAGSVFGLLLIFQLLPLVVGIAIKSRYDAVAVRLRPLMMELMGLTLLVLLALLFMSRYQVAPWPGEVAITTTKLAETDVITKVTDFDPKGLEPQVKILFANADLPAADELVIAKLSQSDSEIGSEEDSPAWVIAPSRDSYTLTRLDPPNEQLKISDTGEQLSVTTVSDYPEDSLTIAGLKNNKISSALRNDFAERHFLLPSDMAVTLEKSWLLTRANTTYLVKGKAAEPADANQNGSLQLLGVSLSPVSLPQAETQPTGLLGAILTFLEGIPIVGDIAAFVAKFVVLLLPLALFAALVTVLLQVGKYTGIAVRNLVGITGEEIPRAMAISTAVRNVSIALLIASRYYSPSNDLGAVAVILVLYLVSLIVTAHESVTWGKEAQVQPSTAQEQAVVITDIKSVPAV